jgi:hypothetical protein
MRNATTVVLALAVAVSGCSGLTRDKPGGVEPLEDYQMPPLPAPEPETEGPTLVNRLLELQQRHTQAVQDLSDERDSTRQLSDEKRQLSQQLASTQTELARAQKELQEANDLLITVRRENDKWKGDVLAHRGEILRAHEAEMKALVKVIRLLGGEYSRPIPPPAEAATTSTSASASSGQAPAAEKGKTAQATKGTASETAGS